MHGLLALESETWHQSPPLALPLDGFTPRRGRRRVTLTPHMRSKPPRHGEGPADCRDSTAPPPRPRPWQVAGFGGGCLREREECVLGTESQSPCEGRSGGQKSQRRKLGTREERGGFEDDVAPHESGEELGAWEARGLRAIGAPRRQTSYSQGGTGVQSRALGELGLSHLSINTQAAERGGGSGRKPPPRRPLAAPPATPPNPLALTD